MTQLSFGDLDLRSKRKRTKRETFLAEMEQVVPWERLLALIAPHYPKGGNGRPPYALATMLRIHLMQNWFGYSDPGMEEALYDSMSTRRFARLSAMDSLPDETTILNFRRLLERHELAAKVFEAVKDHLHRQGLLLKEGTMMDATIIHAPSSTKNEDKARDPEMHQTKKGNHYYFGMKAHIGADAESGLVHTVRTTSANAADITEAAKLLHGEERYAYADAGYTGVAKREEIATEEAKSQVEWYVAEKRGKIEAMAEGKLKEQAKKVERLKAQIRAKVEHPFRVVKRQFGYVKVRFRGLTKNTAQIVTLFALSNLWMARYKLLVRAGELRPQLAC
jgi:IS5 family transposase